MNKHLSWILLIILTLSSCESTNKADHSLSLEEYYELGMPGHEHVWNMSDYSNAFYVINTLKYENPKTLPTRASEKSGLLFARMISLENLSFLQDITLPLHAKADMIKWFVNTLMELKVAYTTPGTQGQPYIQELIDIDIFRLRVSHKMLELGKQINESDDPSDVDMQSDYPQIQQMYVNLLAELLGKHQQTELIPTETLELLSDSISASVNMNMHWFDESAAGTIQEALRTVSDGPSSKKIKGNYQELIGIL